MKGKELDKLSKEEDISQEMEVLELEIEKIDEETDKQEEEKSDKSVEVEDEPVIEVIEEEDNVFREKEKQLSTSPKDVLDTDQSIHESSESDSKKDDDIEEEVVVSEGFKNYKEWIKDVPKYPDFVMEIKNNSYIFGEDVEIKDKIYLFSGHNVLEQFSLEDYPEHLFYIAHFDNSDVGIITLEGNIKYAYILTKKKLQEQGILLEGQELFVLNKRKLSSAEMEVMYMTVPREKYTQLIHKSMKTRQGFILFDYFTLLYGLFLKEKHTKAYVLHCGNEVFVLAGVERDVFLVKKFNLVDDRANTIEEIMFTIRQEIENHPVGKDITHIEWIEGFSHEPYVPESIPDTMTLTKWPISEFNGPDRKIYTSFPFLLNNIHLKASFTPLAELVGLKIQKLEKKVLGLVSIILIGIIILLSFLYRENTKLENQIVPLQNKISELKDELYSLEKNLIQYSPSEFKNLKEFAKEIKIATDNPKIVTLLNSLTILKPFQIYITGFKISYFADKIEFIEEGNINADVISAQTIFNNYILSLEEKGYIITTRYLNLNVDLKKFKLTFYYPMK